MARSFGIPEDRIYVNSCASFKDLKNTYTALLKLSRKMSADDEPHVFLVYVGGHGATSSEKQIYLLNSENPMHAQFQIELKLRYLVKDAISKCRVMAVYDCCRVPLSAMPGLAMGRGVAGGADGESPNEDEEEDVVKYFHI